MIDTSLQTQIEFILRSNGIYVKKVALVLDNKFQYGCLFDDINIERINATVIKLIYDYLNGYRRSSKLIISACSLYYKLEGQLR